MGVNEFNILSQTIIRFNVDHGLDDLMRRLGNDIMYEYMVQSNLLSSNECE